MNTVRVRRRFSRVRSETRRCGSAVHSEGTRAERGLHARENLHHPQFGISRNWKISQLLQHLLPHFRAQLMHAQNDVEQRRLLARVLDATVSPLTSSVSSRSGDFHWLVRRVRLSWGNSSGISSRFSGIGSGLLLDQHLSHCGTPKKVRLCFASASF